MVRKAKAGCPVMAEEGFWVIGPLAAEVVVLVMIRMCSIKILVDLFGGVPIQSLDLWV